MRRIHMMQWWRLVLSAAAGVLATVSIMSLVGGWSPAGATGPTPPPYNGIHEPSPAFDVPTATLDAAVSCSADARSAGRDIILVIPPTLFDPSESYSWNYLPAFAAQHWPYCTVTTPADGDGDIQVAAEYVVAAIRYLHALSGRQVELFGWSQGASTLPRWVLRWWPDVRPMVASLVGLAPDNEYGADTVSAVCAYECFPAAWQETRRLNGAESHFMAAMNSVQQTFPGIAYTDIWSVTDEVAGLNIGSQKVSPLPAAPNVLNVSTQSICPLQVVEHLTIPASSAAYAVAMAALATPGQLPELSKIDKAAVCAQPLMPYVSPPTLAAHELQIAALVGPRALTGMITSEPPLKCYVASTCPEVPAAS